MLKAVAAGFFVLVAATPGMGADDRSAATLLATMREDGAWSQSEAQAWIDACAAAAPAVSDAPGQRRLAAGCVASLYAHQAAAGVTQGWRAGDLSILGRGVDAVLGVDVEAILAPLLRTARPCPWDVPQGCERSDTSAVQSPDRAPPQGPSDDAAAATREERDGR